MSRSVATRRLTSFCYESDPRLGKKSKRWKQSKKPLEVLYVSPPWEKISCEGSIHAFLSALAGYQATVFFTVHRLQNGQNSTADGGFPHTEIILNRAGSVNSGQKESWGFLFLWIEKAGTQKSVPAMEAFYFCSVSFSSSMSWRACSGPSTRWGVSSTNRVGRPTRLSLRTSSKAG